MENRGMQQPYDGLHVAHESGLELVQPGMGAYHSHSTLPEVSSLQPSSEVWQQHYQQQFEKANSVHGYNEQAPYQQSSPAPAYISSNTLVPGTTGFDDGLEVAPRRRERILGMKRKVLFAVLAVVILFVVAGIAAGVGITLANRKPSHKDSKIIVPSTASGNITCPAADSQIYQVADTDRYFQIICDVDYGNDGAVDLTNQPEYDMAGCIEACAMKRGCTAAGWGNYNNNKICFLKKDITQSHEATGWMFTKEVEDPNKKDTKDHR